jgi:hypothetical protein
VAWEAPDPYVPDPRAEQNLRNDARSGLGSVGVKLLNMLDGRSAKSVGLEKVEARMAIEDRIVPEKIYRDVLAVAEG